MNAMKDYIFLIIRSKSKKKTWWWPTHKVG